MSDITITKEVYDELLEDQKILNALRAGGVDNWEWYGASLEDAGMFDDD